MLDSSDHGAAGPGGARPFCPYSAMNGREQRRQCEAQSVPERVGHARDRERNARQDADDALGRHAQPVGAEAAHARERAAGQVLDAEREQRDEQAHDQPDVTVELVVHDLRRGARAPTIASVITTANTRPR